MTNKEKIKILGGDDLIAVKELVESKGVQPLAENIVRFKTLLMMKELERLWDLENYVRMYVEKTNNILKGE
jgi:hypothetical protein